MAGYLKFLFNPNGRISRKDIWLVYLFPLISVLFIAVMLNREFPIIEPVLLFFAWPSIAVSAKRFHDRGMSGWWALLIAVSLAAVFALLLGVMLYGHDVPTNLIVTVYYIMIYGPMIFTFIVNYCLPGQVGPNEYGPDPLDRTGNPADAFD